MEITRQSLQDRQLSLIEHYLNRLDDLSQAHTQGGSWAQEALRSFDQDWQQLQAQQQWAVSMARRNKRAAALVVAFPERASTLLMQGDLEEAVRWIEDALIWVDAKDFKARYRLLQKSHELQRQRLDVERIRAVLDELEGLAQSLDDDRSRAEVAQMKAEYFEMVEDYPSELLWSERALTFALRAEDQALIAETYHQLGFACTRVEQYGQAETQLNTAITLFEQLGMTAEAGSVLNSLAINAYSWNKFEDALRHSEEALAITRGSGHRQRELTFLSNLALFAPAAADLEKALLYAKQAWTMAKELNARASEQTALGGLILASGELGLEDELMSYIDQARKQLSETPSTHLDAMAGFALMKLLYEQGKWAHACEFAYQRAMIEQQQNNDEHEHDASLIWGSSLMELGRLDEAAVAFARCLELQYKQNENPMAAASALASMSYTEERRGHTTEAQTYLDQFFECLAENSIMNVNQPFDALWHARCTCKALHDSRLVFLMQEFDMLLQRYLSHLHDERLRTSFLKNINIQRLMAARAEL